MSVVTPAEFTELPASTAWYAIDIISDLHLDATLPRTVEAFEAQLQDSALHAGALFILGDLFEVWVGDDAANMEDAGTLEQRCAAALRAAAARVPVFFMHGNRDFLVGEHYLSNCGVRLLPDPTILQAFGRRYLLSHGDALCLGDTAYQQFRAQVRSAEWQHAFLAKPLTERRAIAKGLRVQSQQLKQTKPMALMDIDRAEALQWMGRARASILIHGHTHQPKTEPVAADDPSRQRVVLSDWDLDHPPLRGEVLRLSAEHPLGLRLPRASIV